MSCAGDGGGGSPAASRRGAPALLEPGQCHSYPFMCILGAYALVSFEDRVLWLESVETGGGVGRRKIFPVLRGQGMQCLPEAGWSTSVPSTCPVKRTLFWKGLGKEGTAPLLGSAPPTGHADGRCPHRLATAPLSCESCVWVQWR